MTTTTLLGIIGVLVVSGAILLITIGLRNPGANEDLMQERLEEIIQSGEQVTLEELEMSQPFTERVIFPLARALGGFIMRFTPQATLDNTRKRLEMSGLASRIEPTVLLAAQIFIAVLLAVLIFFLFNAPGNFFTSLLYAGGAAVLGYFMPTLYVQGQINQRQNKKAGLEQ